jgi:hypothetical protein
MKILPEGKPSLDGLPLFKTKNNIIGKSLGHPEVQKLYCGSKRDKRYDSTGLLTDK